MRSNCSHLKSRQCVDISDRNATPVAAVTIGGVVRSRYVERWRRKASLTSILGTVLIAALPTHAALGVRERVLRGPSRAGRGSSPNRRCHPSRTPRCRRARPRKTKRHVKDVRVGSRRGSPPEPIIGPPRTPDVPVSAALTPTAGTPTTEPPSSAWDIFQSPLRWPTPTLAEPTTIELGSGYTETKLSPRKDYLLELPPGGKHGGTTIDGGHNVVLTGGAISLERQLTAGEEANARRAIYIKGATGVVQIEGVLIDNPNGAEFDGIDIDAPEATVQLENLRIVGLRGGLHGFHADVVQPWGGVANLRIDRLTGSSNYQGLSLQQDLGPIGTAQLFEVDLTATAEEPVDGGGHMLWLTSGTSSCSSYPVTLEQVFVEPRPGRRLVDSVWPSANSGLPCAEVGVATASWPDLMATGTVQAGTPPGREFVPEGIAGGAYVSPGYSAH